MTHEIKRYPCFDNKAQLLLTPWRSHPYVNVIPNAAARSATTPLATRWPADDLDEVGVAEPVMTVLAGEAVATAPTPPVIGPLSGTGASFEPMAFAAAKYAAKVFPVVGTLIAPTIPLPQ